MKQIQIESLERNNLTHENPNNREKFYKRFTINVALSSEANKLNNCGLAPISILLI